MKLKTKLLTSVYELQVDTIIINTTNNRMYQVRWFSEKKINLELLLPKQKDRIHLAEIEVIDKEVSASEWLIVLELE